MRARAGRQAGTIGVRLAETELDISKQRALTDMYIARVLSTEATRGTMVWLEWRGDLRLYSLEVCDDRIRSPIEKFTGQRVFSIESAKLLE